MITFRNIEHENRYNDIIRRMHCSDCYHSTVAYLLALDDVVYSHVSDVFDFENDSIRKCFRYGWQTGTSRKTIALAFNLWNSFSRRGLTDVADIFDGGYAQYYLEAVKIRFSISVEININKNFRLK